MPVKQCSDGKWKIGSGECMYDTKEDAESAYKGYLGSKYGESKEPRKFDFIKTELTEARYIRIERNVAGHTMADIGETFFEHMIMLQQLRYENSAAAQKYAKETLRYYDFSAIRAAGTDLHNLAAIINNPDKFKDSVGIDPTIHLPFLQFKRYLRDVASNRFQPSLDRQFFYKLQKSLGIKNSILKRMRLIIQDYTLSTLAERRMIATRLTLHFKQDRRFMSDLFKPWQAATKDMKLDSDDVDKAEEKGFKVPSWAKVAAAGAAGYYLGKKVG